jgi:hypothetical protein
MSRLRCSGLQSFFDGFAKRARNSRSSSGVRGFVIRLPPFRVHQTWKSLTIAPIAIAQEFGKNYARGFAINKLIVGPRGIDHRLGRRAIAQFSLEHEPDADGLTLIWKNFAELLVRTFVIGGRVAIVQGSPVVRFFVRPLG